MTTRGLLPAVDFLVNRITDIDSKVISFLEKYPLQSLKQKDSKDLCKAAIIIGSSEPLTVEGLEKL